MMVCGHRQSTRHRWQSNRSTQRERSETLLVALTLARERRLPCGQMPTRALHRLGHVSLRPPRSRSVWHCANPFARWNPPILRCAALCSSLARLPHRELSGFAASIDIRYIWLSDCQIRGSSSSASTCGSLHYPTLAVANIPIFQARPFGLLLPWTPSMPRVSDDLQLCSFRMAICHRIYWCLEGILVTNTPDRHYPNHSTPSRNPFRTNLPLDAFSLYILAPCFYFLSVPIV